MTAKRNSSTRTNKGDPFIRNVKELLLKVPRGKVATYGQIAAYAGNPLAARQVVRVLHSSSEKEGLPWHRIINRQGKISLKPGDGYEIQKEMLEKEGIIFGPGDIIDLKKFLWKYGS